MSNMCLTRICSDVQEVDYIEAYISDDKDAAAAEACAAREAQAARLAKDARAEGSFLRWQRFGQLVTSQRALPALGASPAPCTAEAASSQLCSLPEEAAAPLAAEDLCIAASLRC